jgi:hypothetical protein
VREDDPQRTQEMDSLPDAEDSPGATAARAEAQAAATEAARQEVLTHAQARASEIKADVAETAARRVEEETEKAHEQVEEAEKAEEKLSRKERKAREKASDAEAEAADARRKAEESAKLRAQTAHVQPPPSLSGAQVTSPGLGSTTSPATAASAHQPLLSEEPAAPAESSPLERPEVQIGLAFAGAFVAARILKRIFD